MDDVTLPKNDYDRLITEIRVLRTQHNAAYTTIAELRTEIQMLRSQTDKYLNIINKLKIEADESLRKYKLNLVPLIDKNALLNRYEELLKFSGEIGKLYLERFGENLSNESLNLMKTLIRRNNDVMPTGSTS